MSILIFQALTEYAIRGLTYNQIATTANAIKYKAKESNQPLWDILPLQ
ncbi:hypothetical protein Q0590_30710 [Rhodocytophaga aerolata]|uniref:Transposase n=1 Tax=Rhodocytophaga aerolata TaxID=455078 RepID=A0ABT8RIQ6_9BACT|nr:hypothetical protein [Rhodocytophaga aerolata]MDO1450685.1 hypothetical protein [Rhodocytophaga aerolata]